MVANPALNLLFMLLVSARPCCLASWLAALLFSFLFFFGRASCSDQCPVEDERGTEVRLWGTSEVTQCFDSQDKNSHQQVVLPVQGLLWVGNSGHDGGQ